MPHGTLTTICYLFTDRISQKVKQSETSVCLFPVHLLKRLTFEHCVWVMTIGHLRLKVKVIDQGQTSMSSTYGRGYTITQPV